jgi:hypothetical protein
MQDDYVGLRDSSIEPVEPEINAIPVENLPSDDSVKIFSNIFTEILMLCLGFIKFGGW